MTRPARAAVRALLALSLAAAAMGSWAGEATAAPDLVTSVVSTHSFAVPVDTVTFTATVRNDGDAAAVDPVVSFQLPSGEDVTVVAFPGSCFYIFNIFCPIGSPPPGSEDLDRIFAPGASTQLSITLTNLPVGQFSVGVNATHGEADGNPLDNSATSTITVEPRSDLKLLLDVSPPQVTAGNSVAVTATVSNSAAGPARDARLLLQVPPELTVLNGGGCAVGALQLTCDLGIVASLTAVERKIQLLVPTEGSFVVIATVSSSRPDPTPLDTQAQVSVIGLEPVGAVIPPPPPAPPAPAPKAKTKTKAKPKKPVRVKIGLLARGVPRKNCVRSRKLRLRLRQPGGAARSRVQIYVGKRRIKTVRGKALRRTVKLSKLPRSGRYKLLVVLTLRDGGRFSGRRTLRACRTSRK